jgi:hypothetical protein
MIVIDRLVNVGGPGLTAVKPGFGPSAIHDALPLPHIATW